MSNMFQCRILNNFNYQSDFDSRSGRKYTRFPRLLQALESCIHYKTTFNAVKNKFLKKAHYETKKNVLRQALGPRKMSNR